MKKIDRDTIIKYLKETRPEEFKKYIMMLDGEIIGSLMDYLDVKANNNRFPSRNYFSSALIKEIKGDKYEN